MENAGLMTDRIAGLVKQQDRVKTLSCVVVAFRSVPSFFQPLPLYLVRDFHRRRIFRRFRLAHSGKRPVYAPVIVCAGSAARRGRQHQQPHH